MNVILREGDFEALFQAPFDCYGEDVFLASPLKQDLKRALDPRRNPLFRDFARRTWFTAHRGDRVVGRILAHIHDASNQLHGTRRGCFGLFDCIDDADVARALLEAASAWLRARGCDEIVGAFNLSITQMIGVVSAGHDHRPYTYQDWSPPHLPRLLEELGFEPFYPMRTFEVEIARVPEEALLGDAQRRLLADPAWRFEPIGRLGLRGKLLQAREVLNDGFADNPMFVPLTEDEFLFASAGMGLVMDTRLSWLAYHHNRPVGCLLCLPDLNPPLHEAGYRLRWNLPWRLWRYRHRCKRAALIYYSVRRDSHGLGVNGAMLHKLMGALRAGGYDTLGGSWISDSNAASLRQLEKLAARPMHRLHLYRRSLA